MILYWIGWLLSRSVGRVFGRWKVRGAENMPSTGGVILAPNHISYLDPPIAGAPFRRQVHFMAKEELFRVPILGALIRMVGAFPVRRGTADREALRQAISLLQSGEVVCIFPEGTRSLDGNLKEAETGFGMIALRAGVPVLPVAIVGTDQVLRRGSKMLHFGRIRLNIGKPLDFTDLRDRADDREAMREVGRRTMAAIAALRAEIL